MVKSLLNAGKTSKPARPQDPRRQTLYLARHPLEDPNRVSTLAVSSDDGKATFYYATLQMPGEEYDLVIESRQPFSPEARVKSGAVEIGRISDADLNGAAGKTESLYDHLRFLQVYDPDVWLLEVLKKLSQLKFISSRVLDDWASRLVPAKKAQSIVAQCGSPRGPLRVSTLRSRAPLNSGYRGPLDMASLAKHMPDLDLDDDNSPRARMLRRMAEEAARQHGSPFASHRPRR